MSAHAADALDMGRSTICGTLGFFVAANVGADEGGNWAAPSDIELLSSQVRDLSGDVRRCQTTDWCCFGSSSVDGAFMYAD